MFIFFVNLFDNKIKGMIRSDGNEDNIWIFRFVVEGNILFKFFKMGDIVSFGNVLSVEMENIFINVMRGMVFCFVCIFIMKLV